jgi:hypothetical protein
MSGSPVGDPKKFLPRLRPTLEGRRWALSLHLTHAAMSLRMELGIA